jgi:hypothetical protein
MFLDDFVKTAEFKKMSGKVEKKNTKKKLKVEKKEPVSDSSVVKDGLSPVKEKISFIKEELIGSKKAKQKEKAISKLNDKASGTFNPADYNNPANMTEKPSKRAVFDYSKWQDDDDDADFYNEPYEKSNNTSSSVVEGYDVGRLVKQRLQARQ